MKLIKKADIILIAVVLLLVLLWFLLTPETENTLAVITVDGKAYKTIDLKSAKGEEIQVGNMLIYADNGEIWVLHSDCPDKLCENTGKIKRAGQVIACVPNKVVITIKGVEADGVTG